MKTRLASIVGYLFCSSCLLGIGTCNAVPFGGAFPGGRGLAFFNGEFRGGTGYLDWEEGVPPELGYCFSMDEEGPFTYIFPSGRCD